MRVESVFLDRSVNLLEEGLDVGIRIGELPDSSLRALRVGSVRRVLVASPAYLEQRGEPDSPRELGQHTIIASSAGDFSAAWPFRFPDREHSVRVMPRLSVSNNDAALAAALEGFGITRLLSYQAATELAEGRLVTLLESFEPPPLPIHIIHRSGPGSANKVRAFIDLMAERLRSDQALSAAWPPARN
jgi:DNA-binding transcriptional LysR family regulator